LPAGFHGALEPDGQSTLSHLFSRTLHPSHAQASPFDFYPMPPSERSLWLDDGLHMTERAYDTIGQLVAQEIARRACPGPPTTANSN
jgi:hypothetical protein